MFKILDEMCIPTIGSKFSAAIDLYAREDVVIGAGETKMIPLGVKLDPSQIETVACKNRGALGINWLFKFLESHYLQLEPRSSLRAKGLIAGTGIIDIDFKQEIQLILSNPIQYIDKQIDFNKYDDYTELDYMGSPSPREDGIKVKYSSSFKIKKGDKIAQIMLKEHKTWFLGISTEEERNGGFGSTGN